MSKSDSQCCRCGEVSDDLSEGICVGCRSDNDPTLPPVSKDQDDVTIPPRKSTESESGSIEKRIGNYDLLEEIARGGMGVVYKARHRNLNRITALKMILGGRFSSSEELQRFQVEAESAAKLDHPAIIPIYEIGESEGQAFFSMKYVEGGSLAEKAASYRTRPRDAAALMQRVAEAVHHAHQRGVLHRDLKPANILLDDNANPYVTDLGLAKDTTGGSDLTHTGAVLGTPRYMPPEQAAGKPVTTAADIYALGAILYELIAGRPPYDGDSSMNVVIQVLEGPPRSPREVYREVDTNLELICLKCLSRDPELRYPTAQAIANDLKQWLAGDAISIKPPSFGALFSTWVKRNQQVAYGIFAISVGVLVCVPLLLGFVSNDMGAVYDRFPDQDRPFIYSFSVPDVVSFLSAVFLLLLIWPSIGLLNAVIAKPMTLFESVKSGARLSVILSVIFYVLAGWLIVIQGVHLYSRTDTNAMVSTLWPQNEIAQEQIIQNANQLYGGLSQIPARERASVVIDRIRADKFASFPYSLGIALLFVVAVAVPIIYGTVLGSILLKRKLPNWLFVFRYLVAWWAISMLSLGVTMTILSAFNGKVLMLSHPLGAVVAIAILLLVVYLTLRRWSEKPNDAGHAGLAK